MNSPKIPGAYLIDLGKTEPHIGFESETPGLGIQYPSQGHYSINLFT